VGKRRRMVRGGEREGVGGREGKECEEWKWVRVGAKVEVRGDGVNVRKGLKKAWGREGWE